MQHFLPQSQLFFITDLLLNEDPYIPVLSSSILSATPLYVPLSSFLAFMDTPTGSESKCSLTKLWLQTELKEHKKHKEARPYNFPFTKVSHTSAIRAVFFRIYIPLVAGWI